jgi:hypothetical protein
MPDPSEEYQQYLARFTAAVGEDVAVGSFVKFKGKLVKKMAFDEFAEVFDEYHKLATHYFESLDRGDTLNDIVVKTVRDHAATLILTAPV